MKAIYKDLLENTEEVLANLEINRLGPNAFEYLENEASVLVTIEDKTLCIQRIGQFTTTLTCNALIKSNCLIESGEGSFSMEVYTEHLSVANDQILVVYSLLQNSEEVAYRSVNFIF